jgi:steroid delta-isomerase-like uncharacterized protein
MSTDPQAASARYLDAWNRHDVDAIVAMHTDDSVFENHTSGGSAVGREAIRRMVEGVFATFPDLHFEGRRVYVREDLVVLEWTATATFANAITRNGRTYPPSGKKISWIGMDVVPMRGGLVARKDVYVDSIGFLRAIGGEIP